MRKRGADAGPSPADRRKAGSEHHLIRDGRGTSLKVITTAADVDGVAQTLALLHQFKWLAIRWEHRTEPHDAFVSLACSLVCRRLPK